jgi:N-methylhydantoinase A
VHAYYVAKKLGLSRLLAPNGAGVASALGLLIAPARVDRVATIATDMTAIDWNHLELAFGRLEDEARAVIRETQLDPDTAQLERLADIRYVGQASELVVPLPPGPYSSHSRQALQTAFEASYVASFTRTPPATPVEIINIRVTATAKVPLSPVAAAQSESTSTTPIKGHRPVYFPDVRTHIETPVLDRYALAAGQSYEGPAVIEERESTLVVGPGGRFDVAESGTIIVTIG